MDIERYSKEYIVGVESLIDYAYFFDILEEIKFSVHVKNNVIFVELEGR